MKKKSKTIDILETIFYGIFSIAIIGFLIIGLFKEGTGIPCQKYVQTYTGR